MAEENLENVAAARRERLRALRAAVELVGSEPEQQAQEQDDREPPSEQGVRFRNYLPRDKNLRPNAVSPPTIPKFDDPVATAPVANGSEDPFVSIAPKKANWDLRRDVAKKLEKLDRRTQRALVELMQEEEKRRQELATDEPMEDKD